jgi:ATP-dependent Lon protease
MLSGAPTKFPNILLVAGPGVGKTHFCSALAAALEIEKHEVSSSTSDPILLCGLSPPYKAARPGKIAQALAIKSNEDKVANCLFFIDEIDKAGMPGRSDNGNTTSFFDQLLPALESGTQMFNDSYFGEKAGIHVGMCSWIMAANDLSLLPGYFVSRLNVYHIKNPGSEDLKAGLLKSIFENVLKTAPYAPFFVPVLSDEVTDLLSNSGQTPREIRRALELALERALSRYSEPPEAGSVWLSPEDFSFPVATQKRSIGFHAEVSK